MPTIATSGSWVAVRGNAVRAVRTEPVCAEVVCVAAVPPELGAEAVDVAAGALPTAGIDGVAMDSDDDAIVPSCVVPLGVAGVGAALAETSVSCPPEPTRESSAVLVCSVVVVCASVVRTG